MRRDLITDARGLTLVELLIALAISGIVGAAAYSIFASTGSASRVSENVTAVQMNVRAAMDIISRDIRQAGFGLDESPVPLTFTYGANTYTFSAPVTVANSATGSDTVTLLGVGHLAGYLQRADDTAHTGINACNQVGDDVLCLDGIDEFLKAGAFDANRRYISVAGAFPMTLDTTGHVLADKRLKIAAASNKMNGNYRNADKIPVYIIQAVQYSISTTLTGCSAISPCLVAKDFSGVRGGGDNEVIAQHIEDLQLAYGIDINPRDRRIDYGASGYTAGDFLSAPSADPKSIVAVRLNLLGKTPLEDTSNSAAAVRPAVEDRPAGTATDHYRRRLVTKVIKIRNPRS